MTARKRKKRIAVVGYGSQGKAIALNLRDSGYDLVVALRAKSKSRARARRDGIKYVMDLPGAVASADIVCFAFPDHLHGRVYTRSIEPCLKQGATLWFLHGTSVHFGLVEPPSGSDVLMVAPHAPGQAVRDEYAGKRTLSAFYAVARNRSGKAEATAIALAKGIGISRKNLLKTTFEDEAVGDLFGEQAVLCGGMAMLIKTGFEVLTESGIKPTHAYLEVAYQLDLIVALVKKFGITGMFDRISIAAQYGSLKTGPGIIPASSRRQMEAALKRIRSGKFARELDALENKDIAAIKKGLKRFTNPRLERAAKNFARNKRSGKK